jgi:hypothetical protein
MDEFWVEAGLTQVRGREGVPLTAEFDEHTVAEAPAWQFDEHNPPRPTKSATPGLRIYGHDQGPLLPASQELHSVAPPDRPEGWTVLDISSGLIILATLALYLRLILIPILRRTRALMRP